MIVNILFWGFNFIPNEYEGAEDLLYLTLPIVDCNVYAAGPGPIIIIYTNLLI